MAVRASTATAMRAARRLAAPRSSRGLCAAAGFAASPSASWSIAGQSRAGRAIYHLAEVPLLVCAIVTGNSLPVRARYNRYTESAHLDSTKQCARRTRSIWMPLPRREGAARKPTRHQYRRTVAQWPVLRPTPQISADVRFMCDRQR